MIAKEREKSTQLEKWVALSKREKLFNPQENYISNLLKGYEGECAFDELVKELRCDCLVLNDLALRTNGQTFQIDTLMISKKGVTIFEVKNYEGDFIYQNEKILTLSSRKEIANPSHQINRTTMLFRQLMEEQRVTFPLSAHVVFVNSQFTLFQAPADQNLILPSMIPRLFQRLNRECGALNNNHVRFSDTLKALHHEDLTFIKLPAYDYAGLKKGVFCRECSSQLGHMGKRTCQCTGCGLSELSNDAILNQIRDYHLLFPDNKLKTSEIHDWCGKLFSKKSIRLVLSKHFELKGRNKGCYYE